MEPIVEKKRRGRKAKNANTTELAQEPVEKIPKKRGRKPKGGKIIKEKKEIMEDNVTLK